jgi:3-oxoacyl-[acyl-carrier-protein] synthase II
MGAIAITSTSVISAAGVGADRIVAAMVARECLIGRDDRGQVEKASRLPWPMAKIDPSDITWPKHEPWWVNNRKFANITAHWAVSSAYLALRNRTPLTPEEASRSAVIMTSGGGGEDELTVNFPRILASAKKDPRPIATLLYEEIPDYSYIMGIPSQIGQFVSKACGFDGANVAIFGECGVGGFGALSAGVRMLQSDEFDRVMVVAMDHSAPRQVRDVARSTRIATAR